MLEPTSMDISARSTEWVRADVPFGNWMVDQVEHDTASAPTKGGPQLQRLPHVGLNSAAAVQKAAGARAKRAAYLPPVIKPVFTHPLPGEGVWRRTGPTWDGGPPVLVTTYRPAPEYPQIVAYVAWFSHTRTQLAYYPGRYEPPNAVVRGAMMVPYDQRHRLLATFNGAFIYTDGNNGSAVNGHTNEPLTDGNATLIGYRNGKIAIVRWTGGPDVGPNVAFARQSLAPIVWNGKLNPGLNTDPNSPQWGYTLGGVTFTPRTGVGIDRHGNLIFVVVSEATVVSLAQVLQHVGAVRAMEFDINPYWHTLITYSHQHRLNPHMVEPQPNQSADRYLVPDDRDFFAVYERLPGAVSDPMK
jgi:Phosphodiester glycosidase